ncbi:MAG: tetratricopeptide (TPR) repeat protein [Paracoccaceae bacterium]
MVFLKAQALAADRKFQEALVIYQAEAGRIFSEKRQDEVAGELMTFAELFAKEPGPAELDAPKADYGKALILFAQVLDTDCSAVVREKVRSRMVELNGLLKKWAEAEQAALAYLDEFDPAWRGTFGSVRRLTTAQNGKATFEGGKRFKVRFHHAEALHRQHRRPEAVRYLRELEEMTKDKADQVALRADTMWLRLMAMTENGSVRDVEEWVKVAREYLRLYPKDVWAGQVAYKISSVYRGRESWEQARGAYQDYLDGKGYQTPAEKPLTLDVKGAGEFEVRRRRHEERREAASFEIGAIFLAEKKFNEAEAQWSKTAKNFPNGEIRG